MQQRRFLAASRNKKKNIWKRLVSSLEEFNSLFANVGYKLKNAVKIDKRSH